MPNASKLSDQSLAQRFGVTTYNALFQWVFKCTELHPNFLSAIVPDLHVCSSELLDQHMNPLQSLENLRQFAARKDKIKIARELHNRREEIELFLSGQRYVQGEILLKEMVSYFDDMHKAFPKAHYNGSMDFLCRLDNQKQVLVEMQIAPEDHWDQRALAYAATVYAHQMRKGMSWGEIRTVIGINILGGGLNNEKHWKENQYMRHYRIQDQVNGEVPPRFLDGIEIIQYSLANILDAEMPQERREWLIFFRDAHNMTEEDVKRTIRTPAVLAAFERAKLSNLPEEVMRNYRNEEAQLKNLSGYMAEKRAEGLKLGKEEGLRLGKEEGLRLGKEEGLRMGEKKTKIEIARNLLKKGVELSLIESATGLSCDEIIFLKPGK